MTRPADRRTELGVRARRLIDECRAACYATVRIVEDGRDDRLEVHQLAGCAMAAIMLGEANETAWTVEAREGSAIDAVESAARECAAVLPVEAG